MVHKENIYCNCYVDLKRKINRHHVKHLQINSIQTKNSVPSVTKRIFFYFFRLRPHYARMHLLETVTIAIRQIRARQIKRIRFYNNPKAYCGSLILIGKTEIRNN